MFFEISGSERVNKGGKKIVNVIIGQKVQEARKKKARRLKQAKEEALIEIERFRSERENAFREYESKHMGSM